MDLITALSSSHLGGLLQPDWSAAFKPFGSTMLFPTADFGGFSPMCTACSLMTNFSSQALGNAYVYDKIASLVYFGCRIGQGILLSDNPE